MQCQQFEKAWQEDHASLAACREQIAQIGLALEAEKERGSTQEEELNRARSEKVRLREELDQVRAELSALKKDLENIKSKRDVEKGEGHAELEGAWHEEDPVVRESPLLTPVKNYWKTPIRSGRSPFQKSLTETTPIKRGRSPTQDVPRPPSPSVRRPIRSPSLEPRPAQRKDIPESAMSAKLVPESAQHEEIGFKPAKLVPESAQRKDIDSILLEIESLRVASTPQWRAIQDDHIQPDSLERSRPLGVGVARGVVDPPTSSSPLLERSLSGLYHAYDIINTLTSVNVAMQEKMESLSRENNVRLV